MSEKGDELQRRALDAPRFTLPDLAEELGVSLHTLKSYRLHRREMPPSVRRQFARLLREKAESFAELADELERSADS